MNPKSSTCALLCAVAVLLSAPCFAEIIADRPGLRPGDQWVFHETGTDAGVSVDRRWSRRVVESLADGMVRVAPPIGDISVFDDSWNPRHPARPEFHPLDFVFPLRVGAEWTFASPPGAYYQRGNARVAAYETIKVPAGTFECFRLEGESVFNQGKSYSETRRMTRWYCPAVKYMAKLQFELDIWQFYGPGTRKVLASELVDFKLASAPTDVLLPPDAAVQPPAESLPAEVRALSGKWAGTWSNAVNSVLVVERIDSPSSATVIYARDRAPALKINESYYGRHRATISNGELQFKLRNGAATVTYALTPSGELAGKYVMENSPLTLIQMKRLD